MTTRFFVRRCGFAPCVKFSSDEWEKVFWRWTSCCRTWKNTLCLKQHVLNRISNRHITQRNAMATFLSWWFIYSFTLCFFYLWLLSLPFFNHKFNHNKSENRLLGIMSFSIKLLLFHYKRLSSKVTQLSSGTIDLIYCAQSV